MATYACDLPASGGYLQATSVELSERLLALETMLFDPSVRRDTNTVAELLTDDFREFGTSGRVYTKLDILAELTTEQPAVITLSDFMCSMVAPTAALVTYTSLTTFDSRAGSHVLRSSLWVLNSPDPRYGQVAGPREPSWRMRFHQGTRI